MVPSKPVVYTRARRSEAASHKQRGDGAQPRVWGSHAAPDQDSRSGSGSSVEEIKPVSTLKHYQIAKFTEKHGVNLEWLLEGRGRAFINEPPNSIRSSAELAALVYTLPEAEQRKIEAVIDLFLEERSP
jgi:hypothetical protein